jgi:hypothetical protein
MIDRALTIAGIAISILSVVVPAMLPNMDKKYAVAGFIFGLLLLGASVGIVLTSHKSDGPPVKTEGPSI